MRGFTCYAILAITALSACQSGNESYVRCGSEDCFVYTPPQNLNQRVASYDATLNRIAPIPGTAWSDVPTSGSTRFQGVGGIVLDAQLFFGPSGIPAIINDSGSLFGDATVTVDYATETLNGRITNFIGDYRGSLVRSYDGTILIRNGTVGVDSPNALSATYSGRLTGENFDGSFSGDLDGKLQGTPVRAIQLVEQEGTATINGSQSDVFFVIAAEP